MAHPQTGKDPVVEYRQGLFSFAWWVMVVQGNSISVLYQAFCEMGEKRREGGLPWLPNSLPNFAQTYYNGSVVFMSTSGFAARATLKESVMVSDKATLVNPQGLHMRPAGLFASTMGKFASEVTVVAPDKEVNGKSPMALMAAGIPCGTEVEVKCDGADEKEALAAAIELIKSGLGE